MDIACIRQDEANNQVYDIFLFMCGNNKKFRILSANRFILAIIRFATLIDVKENVK